MTSGTLAASAPGGATEGTLHVFSSSLAFDSAQRMAKALCSSTLVPKDYQGPNGLANCLIALEISARMGVSPFVVMQNMVPIHGRPTWSSKYLIATINASGRFTPLRFVFDNDAKPTSCYAVATDKATGEELKGENITMALVQAEGWLSRNGSKWRTMPGQMFRYRAASWWANVYCPEIALGLMTQEEAVDIEAHEVRSAVVSLAPQAAIQASVAPPELAAAAAPVATMTEQQMDVLTTALGRQLTPVGIAAFRADACAAFEVAELAQIPAEHHSRLMQRLADAGSRERWNRGCASESGEPILSAEEVAALTPKAAEPESEPEAAPEPPAKPAAPARQQPARAAAAAQQAAPAPAADELATEVQAELV